MGRLLTKALKMLEYRGYDSVGISVLDSESRLVVRKGKGKIDEVAAKLFFEEVEGSVGIGHTRWATHGAPSDANAHPHVDCKGAIAVVHNGIVRNYLELKRRLLERGHAFRSETDTEVVAHLLEELRESSPASSFFEVFKKAVKMLQGSFALAVITLYEPNKIFFARKESPLILGFGEVGGMVASDIPALLDYTNLVAPLNDDEVGWISWNSAYVENLRTGSPVDLAKRFVEVHWKPEMATKGGYPHFMIKEIYEQPLALKSTYEGLLSDDAPAEAARIAASARRLFVSAAGTSYHAGLLLKAFVERLARVPVYAFVSSEYKHYSKLAAPGDVLIVLSQSGETIDTLKALRAFKEAGARTIAITNVLGSTIGRESDVLVLMRAGPEICVAATKTFTSQVLVGAFVAVRLAAETGALDRGDAKRLEASLESASRVAGESIVASEELTKSISEILSRSRSAYFLGRGLGYPLAMEAALKLKEVAYVHAEAYPAGESKHGPIALVEEGFPVIFVATSDSLEEIGGNVAEMRARGALAVLYTASAFKDADLASLVVELPSAEEELLEPFAFAPALQLLAYYTAVKLGRDPDKPRNLAKTVTVE